jgi:hypothetical protein
MFIWRMASSGMLRRVALVRADVSEELSASIIRVTLIGELGMLAITSMHRFLVTANVPSSPILFTQMMEALCSSKTSVLTRATRRNIPEDGILHSHHHENLKSYIDLYMSSIWWQKGCCCQIYLSIQLAGSVTRCSWTRFYHSCLY